jgi:hypothetical protein
MLNILFDKMMISKSLITMAHNFLLQKFNKLEIANFHSLLQNPAHPILLVLQPFPGLPNHDPQLLNLPLPFLLPRQNNPIESLKLVDFHFLLDDDLFVVF